MVTLQSSRKSPSWQLRMQYWPPKIMHTNSENFYNHVRIFKSSEHLLIVRIWNLGINWESSDQEAPSGRSGPGVIFFGKLKQDATTIQTQAMDQFQYIVQASIDFRTAMFFFYCSCFSHSIVILYNSNSGFWLSFNSKPKQVRASQYQTTHSIEQNEIDNKWMNTKAQYENRLSENNTLVCQIIGSGESSKGTKTTMNVLQ